MKRRLVLVVLLLASMAAITPAQGDSFGAAQSNEVSEEPPIPDVAPPEIDDPISDAELRDIQFIAGEQGLSLQDAIDRYGWNDNFALMVSGLREAHRSDFASAEIVGHENAWVAFSGQAPKAALEAIEAFGSSHGSVSVDVRSDFGYAETDVESAIETVHYAVLQNPEVRSATTSFDVESRVITTSVLLGSTAPDSILDDLRATAISSLNILDMAGLLERVSLSVVESSHAVLGGVDSNVLHYGGESLVTCTSGFVVKNASQRGPSTAGHCGDSLTDDGAGLGFKWAHQGQHGDFQWHTGGQAAPDDFYAGNATTTEVDLRDVSGVGAPVVGQTLCKNGITNFKDCQNVRKLGVCHDVYCALVQMEARLAAPGDSGGSVYFGNTAYGLHQGWHYDIFPADRDLFSRADRIDDGINMNVATG